mgnify:FL=1
MADPKEKTVLIVDDEPDVQTYFQVALEEAGFNTMVAGDGMTALEKVKENPPDLISLDLVMPKKSGMKFLYEMKKDKELKHIPVLIVTAHARDEMGKEDLDKIMENRMLSGPGLYLEKPVTPKKYVKCIKQMLGMEIQEDQENTSEMRQELQEKLKGADPDTLKKMLEQFNSK